MTIFALFGGGRSRYLRGSTICFLIKPLVEIERDCVASLKRVQVRGSFLALLKTLGPHLTPSEFTILLKWWLGISLLPLDDLDDPNVGCPSCGEVIDVYGDHFLCCRKGGHGTREDPKVFARMC